MDASTRDRLRYMLYSMGNRMGIDRLLAGTYRGVGTALMFHDVVDDCDAVLRQDICCSTRFLGEVITWLRSEGYEILPVSHVPERLRSPAGNRFAILTFDDGYRGNLTKALPILSRLEAPFAVFPTTDIITRRARAWWLQLRELFMSRSQVDLEPMHTEFVCDSLDAKSSALRQATAWVAQDFRREEVVSRFLHSQGIASSDVLEQYCLSESELIELSRNPWVTIGGHTETHRALATLEEREVVAEISENRTFLEQVTGMPVDHFAYPFGDRSAASLREFGVVKRLGFRTAWTTRLGNLFGKHASQPESLPRIEISARDNLRSMAFKIRGGIRWIVSRSGSPMVTD